MHRRLRVGQRDDHRPASLDAGVLENPSTSRISEHRSNAHATQSIHRSRIELDDHRLKAAFTQAVDHAKSRRPRTDHDDVVMQFRSRLLIRHVLSSQANADQHRFDADGDRLRPTDPHRHEQQRNQ